MQNKFNSFSEARKFLREHPLEAKKLIGFKGYRKRFFNIVELKLSVSLRKLKETDNWIYFDVECAYSHKNNPQIKLSRDISLDSLDYPLLITFQNSLCVRPPKILSRDYYLIDCVNQIVIEKQRIPLKEEKQAKVFIGLYKEKETMVGSWSKLSVDSFDHTIFHHCWKNTSNGGTHWEKGIFVVLPFSQKFAMSYVRHGKKTLLENKTITV